MKCPLVPISNGELLDKITILIIKKYFSDSSYISMELNELLEIAKKLSIYKDKYIFPLLEVNKTLWVIENRLRVLEKENNFNTEFLQLARCVYRYNDIRAEIKKKINKETNSEFMEIKIYD